MGGQGGSKQGLRVRVQWLATQFEAIGDLYNLPQVHHGNLVAEVGHCGQVVGNKEIADTQTRLQRLQEANDVGPNGDVQGRDRLIEHDQAGVGRQGSGNGQALALPTAELVGKETGHVRSETDQLQQCRDTRPHFTSRHALVGLNGLADNVPHAHARTQATVGILNHYLDLASVVYWSLAIEVRQVRPR